MGKEEVMYHLRYDQPLVNCSTTALHAILPFLPETESIRALFRNTHGLEDIYDVVSYELYRNGQYVKPYCMSPDDRPSRFFYQLAHAIRHGQKDAKFIGGLMLTYEEDPNHVIAITGVHESCRPKFDIVDIAPFSKEKPYIRTVSGNFLDRRVAPDFTYGTTAAAIVTIPIEQLYELPDFNPSYYREIDHMSSSAEIRRFILLERAKGNYI